MWIPLQFCEDLEAVDIVNNVSARFVMDQYVSLDLPVVVKDEMQDWPVTNLENIIQVLKKNKKTITCGIDSCFMWNFGK